MINNKYALKMAGLGSIFILIGLACDVIIQNFGLLILKITAKIFKINENTFFPILAMLLMMSGLLYVICMYMKKYIHFATPEDKFEPFQKEKTFWIFKGYGLIILSGVLVNILKMLLTGSSVNSANQLALIQMGKSGLAYKIYLVFLSMILAPLLEESIFRGVLMNYFFKNSFWWVNVLFSGLLFGLFHVIFQKFQLLALIQYSLTGIILAIVYKKTKRIQYSMVTHCLNNTIALIILLFS